MDAGSGTTVEAGPGRMVEAGSGFRQGIWQTFGVQDGLPSEVVLEMLQDRNGHLWFSTMGGGVCRYDGQSFTTFTTADGLAGDWVWPILEDRSGNLWFGTSNYLFERNKKSRGVSRYDGDSFVTFTTADGLANNEVWTIEEDRQGRLWFGTGGGVSRYDGDSFMTFTTADGLANNDILAIKEDRQGYLWIGTWDGVSRYDGDSFTTFTEADGLADDNVLSIEEDRQGDLWIGTWGGGMSRYDGQQFTTFTTANGLADNTVFDSLEDQEGYLWSSAFPSGLNRYDSQRFRTFTTADGLGNNQVLDILEDREGTLWFSTFGGGVSRYDGEVFQTLSRKDGLLNDAVQEVIEDRSGHLWFATEGGLTRYRPSHTPPGVVITQVLADRAYTPDRVIRLSSTQDYIHFVFRGSSFTTLNQKLIYLYRLQGYDTAWRQTRQRQVEYSDLPVGDYVFEVKAVDQDLNYSSAAELSVVVHPPYGQIALIGGLGMALVGLVLATGYSVRKRRQLRYAEQALMQELEEELQTARELQINLMPTESP